MASKVIPRNGDALYRAALSEFLQQLLPCQYVPASRSDQVNREGMRLIFPFFSDFDLKPDHESLLLRWSERDSDQIFGASQASDGMLRVMALVALLQQPEDDLPDVLILDEPELGLHPYAIEVLAALLQSASQYTQVIVATQSVSLIDRFEPHDIVVVDRVGRESTFGRLDDAGLSEWRERYTLSELWEKNVLGGTP